MTEMTEALEAAHRTLREIDAEHLAAIQNYNTGGDHAHLMHATHEMIDPALGNHPDNVRARVTPQGRAAAALAEIQVRRAAALAEVNRLSAPAPAAPTRRKSS